MSHLAGVKRHLHREVVALRNGAFRVFGHDTIAACTHGVDYQFAAFVAQFELRRDGSFVHYAAAIDYFLLD